jgi:hypothetical protein
MPSVNGSVAKSSDEDRPGCEQAAVTIGAALASKPDAMPLTLTRKRRRDRRGVFTLFIERLLQGRSRYRV